MPFCSISLQILAYLALIGLLPAVATESSGRDPVAALRTIMAEPDAQIDFARVKLLFDKFIDPTIDVSASIKEIDEMADTARRMAGPNAAPLQRLAAVRRVIYVSGDWNGRHPFQYDLTDPHRTILPTDLARTTP